MLCANCKKRELCRKACPALEAELSKVEHYQRELVVDPNILGTINASQRRLLPTHSLAELEAIAGGEKPNFPELTGLENDILHRFFNMKQTHKEIARALSGGKKHRKINERRVKYLKSKALKALFARLLHK